MNDAAGTQNEDPSLRAKAWLGSASTDRRAFVIFSQGADWLGVAGFGHDATMTVTSATASGGVAAKQGEGRGQTVNYQSNSATFTSILILEGSNLNSRR